MKKTLFVVSLLWDQLKFSLRRWFAGGGITMLCRTKGSSMFPSKRLFEMIRKDHPDDKSYYVLFSRILTDDGVRYAFFVNPDWQKHGVQNPRMIMTQQMVMHEGRIGLHSYQPTVMEIFTAYGIRASEAELKVRRSVINDEPYYVLEKQ